MTRTQKLGLCTWLPEDPVSLAEMNDNFSRLDANGGRSLLLAESGMRTLGGVMAAVAHQGGHAMYAERVQVDAFQDAAQLAVNNGVYYREKELQLLPEALQSFKVLGNPGSSSTNAYLNVTNLTKALKYREQRMKLFDFYPPCFGQLTSIAFSFFQTPSKVSLTLIIQDAETLEDVLTTPALTTGSEQGFACATDFLLDPNHRYSMYAYLGEDSGTGSMDSLQFTITPLLYPNGSVTMKPMTLPAGTESLELLVHDNAVACTAALRFDAGEFTTLTQVSEAADQIPGGTASTLRRYRLPVPAGAQTAQLRLTLNGSTCKIYDYALIAL